MAEQDAGGSPAGGTATGGTAGAGSATDAGAQGAGTKGSAGSSDYTAKLAAGGDFAVREAVNQQSRADRAEDRARKAEEWLGSLSRFRDQGVTGDAVAEYVAKTSKWTNDPELMKRIEAWEKTGRFQNGRDDPDSFEDDLGNESGLSNEEAARIKALEGETARVSSQLARSELSNHLEEVFGHLELEPERKKDVIEKMQAQVMGWANDPNGRDAIARLSGPGGLKTVKALVFTELDPKEIVAASRGAELREKQRLRDHETDSLSGIGTTGNEPPPEFKDAAEAFRFAAERVGKTFPE